MRKTRGGWGETFFTFPAATAPFPKSCASYFRFTRFLNTFPLYYLRAWHRLSLKLQYFTPFLRNVSLDRLWFYCAHSYDFCRIYSCINTTYFSRNVSYTILFLYQRKGGFIFIFMATYIPSMITVLSQLASPVVIIRGSSRP